ncbi:MAG: hypothetical protein VYA80_06270 [Pseudomonadota bacterium]|nr:hypothetical protein [Pseudomonadota bacterium]
MTANFFRSGKILPAGSIFLVPDIANGITGILFLLAIVNAPL